VTNVQTDIPEYAYHLLEFRGNFRTRFGLQQKQQIHIRVRKKQAMAISTHRNQGCRLRHIAVAPDILQYAVNQLRMLAQKCGSLVPLKKLIGKRGAPILDKGAPVGNILPRNGS